MWGGSVLDLIVIFQNQQPRLKARPPPVLSAPEGHPPQAGGHLPGSVDHPVAAGEADVDHLAPNVVIKHGRVDAEISTRHVVGQAGRSYFISAEKVSSFVVMQSFAVELFGRCLIHASFSRRRAAAIVPTPQKEHRQHGELVRRFRHKFSQKQELLLLQSSPGSGHRSYGHSPDRKTPVSTGMAQNEK